MSCLISVLALVVASRSSALPAQPPSPPPLQAKAESLFVAGWFHAADSLLGVVERTRPNDVRLLCRRATIATLENRLADARALLERARKRAPADPDVWSEMALVSNLADDFPLAAGLYEAIGHHALAATLASFGGRRPYRIMGDTASVSFVQTDPLPLIQARVNGSDPVHLLIDTGSAELMLDSTFAATIGAPRFGTETGTFAADQKARYEYGRVDSLALGRVTIHDLPVVIQNLQRFSAATGGKPVTGIVGTTVLRHFTFTLDYPGRRLLLEPLATGDAAMEDGTIETPIWMASDHILLARGTLGAGPSFPWVLDSGFADAALTCPESTLRDAGIPLPAGAGSEGMGGGGRLKVRPFRAPRATLGGAEATGLRGLLGPFPTSLEFGLGFRVGGILSHEFLRAWTVRFDPGRMRVGLKPAGR
jgi:hypothetical protein